MVRRKNLCSSVRSVGDINNHLWGRNDLSVGKDITDPLYLPLKRGGLVCPHLESSRKLYKSLSINLFSKQSNCLSPFRGDGRGVRNEDQFVRILRVLLEVLLIVFLYNYAVHLLYKKS